MKKWKYAALILSLTRFKWVISFMYWPFYHQYPLNRVLGVPGSIWTLHKSAFSASEIKPRLPFRPFASHWVFCKLNSASSVQCSVKQTWTYGETLASSHCACELSRKGNVSVCHKKHEKGEIWAYHCCSAEDTCVMVSDDVSGEEFRTFLLTVLPSMQYDHSKRRCLVSHRHKTF